MGLGLDNLLICFPKPGGELALSPSLCGFSGPTSPSPQSNQKRASLIDERNGTLF